MCSGRSAEIEEWQWLRPDDLTADAAKEAISTLSESEGKSMSDEAGWVQQIAYNRVEGYLLLQQAKTPLRSEILSELKRLGKPSPVETFCNWIATHADPE